jgi:glycosyltransferase involved in cell wall biosynthesis
MNDNYETLLIGGHHEEGEAESLYIVREYGVEPRLIDALKRVPNLKSDYKAYKEIKNIIKEFKPDIVHTHASKAGFIGRLAAFSCKVPIVVHTFHGHVFHSYFGKFKTNIIRYIEKMLAWKSTGIVAVSEVQKTELSKTYKICGVEKVKVIPYGFDLLKFNSKVQTDRVRVREEYNIQSDEIALAIIGRVTAIKNHHFFLDVIEKVLEKGIQKIKVFIVGDGDLMCEIKLKSEVINNQYGEKIILTSWIKDIAQFNPGLDIICLTSDNEGAPISLIEAQASEIAIISTDVGGVRDVMINNETGYIVDKGNLKEYTEKLCYLIENNEIRKQMGKNGWEFVKNKFHYDRLIEEMDSYYKELLLKNGIKK